MYPLALFAVQPVYGGNTQHPSVVLARPPSWESQVPMSYVLPPIEDFGQTSLRRSPLRMPAGYGSRWTMPVQPPSMVVTEQPRQPRGYTGPVEVYGTNLVAALTQLERLVIEGKNHFIAIDTEFPGVVVEQDAEQAPYQKVRANVEKTALIQLGVSVFNGDGVCAGTFQFNFSYSGLFNPQSLCMLQEAGIDLVKNRSYGASHLVFGALLSRSRLLRNPNLVWIVFHGCFDLAYMMQVIGGELPADLGEFKKQQQLLFPHVMDTKQLAMDSLHFQGGLERLATQVNVVREGAAHQAGSDSKLTGDAFFKLISDHPAAQECYYKTLNTIHGL